MQVAIARFGLGSQVALDLVRCASHENVHCIYVGSLHSVDWRDGVEHWSGALESGALETGVS